MGRAADVPFVLLVEARADQRRRGLLFSAPERVIACREPRDVPRCLALADEARRAGRHVAGFLAYEAGYGLEPKLAELRARPATEHVLWLAVFDGMRELRGAELAELLAARGAGQATSIEGLRFDLSRARYRQDFARIQAHLRAGDTYQVCHSLRARFRLRAEPAALFERLCARQPTAYSALIDTGDYAIVSLSPELLVRKSAGRVELRPMKGTAEAGRDAREDAERAAAMRRDPKTRAENVMIVDLLRNDIGRLARPGSVRVPELFAVERFGSVLQMTSTIVADVEPELGLSELMRALFPSGSVTGAPKLRTMQLIAELEHSPRGIFCGSIGYAAPDGEVCFNVAIRSLCVDRAGEAVLGVGSGVVVDSQSDDEYDECLLKAGFVAALAR